MLTVEGSEAIRPMVRVVQIICGAMIAGVLFLVAVAIVAGPLLSGPMPPAAGNGPPGETPAGANGFDDFRKVLTWFTVAFATVLVVLSIVVPRAWTARARCALAAGPNGPLEAQSGGAQLIVSLFSSQFIIGIALCEAGAFFAAIAYLLGGRPLALAAAVVMIGAIAARFPTRARVENWIERERENLFVLKHALR